MVSELDVLLKQTEQEAAETEAAEQEQIEQFQSNIEHYVTEVGVTQ